MVQRAIAALNNGQLGLAESAARSVTTAAPKYLEGWIALGRVLTQVGRFDDARGALDTADRIRPFHVGATLARAQLNWREGRDEDVIVLCAQILKNQPNVEATLLTGMAHRRLGRFEKALGAFRRIPGDATVACGIAATLLDMDDPRGAIDVLTPHVSNAALPAMTRYNILHSIGEAQEKRGEYADAMRSYTAANTSIPVKFDEAGFRAGVALMREVFSAEAIRKSAKATVRTSRPVFIAAMPRSGTTLLDRIIASHPQAGGAGETRALRGQASEWSSKDPDSAWPRIARRFGAVDLDRIANRYLAETNRYGPNALRISDKHLQNWTMVGLVAMALPDARIIHLQRDPMDNGISCFERIEPSAIPWSADLKHIGLAIRGTDALMEHWKAVSGMPILTVQYEDLVRDQEAQTRRILDFIGLPWNDACMQHHVPRSPTTTGRGEHAPPTLGSEQAARPISDKSIGRAARFGTMLDPLHEALQQSL